jgi:hypothetical protein
MIRNQLTVLGAALTQAVKWDNREVAVPDVDPATRSSSTWRRVRSS